ncbi:MAG: RidA family protein [Bacteroidetes bacterium]|nr:RidA family protein [Bacteroidota bacterium]
MRRHISSGALWEERFGYSRAVRAGNIIEVAGTTAVDGETVIGEGNIYEQTKFIFRRIERALEEVGGTMADVVRTRMYVTDISQSEAVGRAHAEFFAAIRPAASMIEVRGFIDPRLLVEIEVTAVLSL